MDCIQTLIFDLGGVLINYDLEADTRALASVGLPEYAEWNHYPEMQRICNDYLNGLLPEDEFCSRLRPYCRPDVTDADICHSMMAVMADLPASRLEALCQLRRQGYRLILLSNINPRCWRYSLEQFRKAGYEVADCFDEVFLTFQLGMAKPDPAVFEAVLQRTGTLPHEALFLDDTRQNVEAARRLGIKSWLVTMNEAETQLEMLKTLKNH